MTQGTGRPSARGVVVVRYWAAARAAAGVESDTLEVSGSTSLADVLRRVREMHAEPRLARVIDVCSVLVGERPAGTRDPADVVVLPGETVELLPPFAGG